MIERCLEKYLLLNKLMKHIKVLVEKHSDGYIAYPLGMKAVVIGQGDTYEEALADVKSAIRCHIKTFGQEVVEEESPVLEAFVAKLYLSSLPSSAPSAVQFF
jgi:predicted RNase H-like HicB family nuclease